jgi:hypothetical protein
MFQIIRHILLTTISHTFSGDAQMYLHVSVGLALAAGIVIFGSTDASARGRPKAPKADYSSNVAPTVKRAHRLPQTATPQHEPPLLLLHRSAIKAAGRIPASDQGAVEWQADARFGSDSEELRDRARVQLSPRKQALRLVIYGTFAPEIRDTQVI